MKQRWLIQQWPPDPRRQVAIAGITTLVLVTIVWLCFIRRAYDAQAFEGAFTVGGVVAALMSLCVYLVPIQPRPARVHSLFRNGSQFNDAFIKGLKEVFSGNSNVISHNTHEITGSLSTQFEQQKNLLSIHATDPNIDVIIIRPIEIDEIIKESIFRCITAGKLVICIDMFVEPIEFQTAPKHQPYFITSDNRLGGKLLAKFLITQIKHTFIIALFGPQNSPPGTSRSLGFLWELLVHNFPLNQIHVCILRDWTREQACQEFSLALSKNEELTTESISDIYVFCGADPICLEIDKLINSAEFHRKYGLSLAHKIKLLGYDGTKTLDSNKFNVQSTTHCVATVDVRPEDQGRRAADVIVRWWKYKELAGSASEKLSPALCEFSPQDNNGPNFSRGP
jgi:DNA-binding LacI/PurR family transcriptional regulator